MTNNTKNSWKGLGVAVLVGAICGGLSSATELVLAKRKTKEKEAELERAKAEAEEKLMDDVRSDMAAKASEKFEEIVNKSAEDHDKTLENFKEELAKAKEDTKKEMERMRKLREDIDNHYT